MNYFNEAIALMKELYGRDVAMPLATVNRYKANIRVINTYYKETATREECVIDIVF
ncbi:hypothetical protein [Clostridium estertheticum]|uniref:Uncharacterized protein n=1 Tax=Clostridium estertheticum TaxID=238834 RepID=A0A7Y3SSZ1_9CLOT|nr:hypothetical protein [Clostridium estertheticum]MBW9173138.1 hypothetical protein [Clostridium estertheticum]NNU74373.1 hypothetical protein [Clostridium estertheticum]WBL49122.1 hypothetical protein LOR37_10840 [Clostridium estertheticum]WLC77216.1 hypothetical protein KTC99_10685 [Clostridium estertheticum]